MLIVMLVQYSFTCAVKHKECNQCLTQLLTGWYFVLGLIL